MSSENEQQDSVEPNVYRDLQLLTHVEDNPNITQRQMSQKVGLALGLTNVLLRNLIQRGFIRVSNATWKRRIYSLTPEGLTHKMHLTVGYIRRVVHHYRTVRETLNDELSILGMHTESRIAIYGTGEFAELVYLTLKELGIEEIAAFSSDTSSRSRFLGMPVLPIANLDSDQFDGIIIGELQADTATLEVLSKIDVPPGKLITFFDGPRGLRHSEIGIVDHKETI